MSIEEHQKQRDIAKTTESQPSSIYARPIFVVQEHNSSHHHYDLRLVTGGVLKSFAILKTLPAFLRSPALPGHGAADRVRVLMR